MSSSANKCAFLQIRAEHNAMKEPHGTEFEPTKYTNG